MMLLDIPEDRITSKEDGRISYDFNLTILFDENKVRFAVDDLMSSWMNSDDRFIERIKFEKLNPCFRQMHISKEIEIKNILDEASHLLDEGKYARSITLLDEVLYYDSEYAEALFLKSKAIFQQGHYVKSLRHYRRAVRADDSLKDVEYHKMLLKMSSEERDAFPKIKRNIYAGDEYFAKGDFDKALECYDKALVNPTNFKNKILSKLLNKKATAFVRLNRISEAAEVFKESVSVKPNDYAFFYLGVYCDVEYIKRAVKITKSQLILKASKLHESGESKMALECLDEFFENHYRVDDDYIHALKLKLDILKRLDMDTSDVESIIDSL